MAGRPQALGGSGTPLRQVRLDDRKFCGRVIEQHSRGGGAGYEQPGSGLVRTGGRHLERGAEGVFEGACGFRDDLGVSRVDLEREFMRILGRRSAPRISATR